MTDFKEKWTWDDSGLLGDFQMTCPCGEVLKNYCLSVNDNDDILTCPKCNKAYKVERKTTIIEVDEK